MSNEHVSQAINRNLYRLPLVLEILDEITQTEDSYPGDNEIRHGVVQAVTTMIQHLRCIQPIRDCQIDGPFPPSEAELIAKEWLRGELPGKLLPRDLYHELSNLLRRLISEC